MEPSLLYFYLFILEKRLKSVSIKQFVIHYYTIISQEGYGVAVGLGNFECLKDFVDPFDLILFTNKLLVAAKQATIPN